MNWQPGDQAMCVKGFYPDTPNDRAILNTVPNPPIPPLIYDVARILLPPPERPDLKGCVGLVLRGINNAVAWRSDHFKKLDPLPPDQVDLPERVPAPV